MDVGVVSNLEVDMEMVGHLSEAGTLDFVVGMDMNLEGSVVVAVAFVDRVALGFGIGSCLFLSPSLGYYLDCFEVVL